MSTITWPMQYTNILFLPKTIMRDQILHRKKVVIYDYQYFINK